MKDQLPTTWKKPSAETQKLMKIYPVSWNNSIKRRNWQSSNCQENKTSLRKNLSREGTNEFKDQFFKPRNASDTDQPRIRANGLLRRGLRRAYSVNDIQRPSFVGQLPPVLNKRHSYPVSPMPHNEKMGGEITTPRRKNAIISCEFKTINRPPQGDKKFTNYDRQESQPTYQAHKTFAKSFTKIQDCTTQNAILRHSAIETTLNNSRLLQRRRVTLHNLMASVE